MYIIRHTHDEAVAVIIEAKHMGNSSIKHVIAQVTGYFAAFDVEIKVPLVFVLTDEYVQIVLYPFKHEGVGQINAVVLPEFSLFDDK